MSVNAGVSTPKSPVAWPLNAHQRAEFDRFISLGFPTARAEDWRYAPTRALAAFADQLLHDDGLADADNNVDIDRLLSIFPVTNGVSPRERVVFRNGLWQPETTQLTLQPIHRDSATLGAVDSALAALNGARAAATLHVKLESNQPVHIIHILDGDAPLLAAPRLEIEASANVVTDITEYFVQVPGSAPVFNNALTAMTLARDATVRYRRLQLLKDNAHSVAELRVRLDANSQLDWFTLDTGAAFARNDVRATLDGANADLRLSGVFATEGRQHVDNRLVVKHAVGDATSRQTYSGLAGDASKAVYHGKVIVAEGADGTRAQQQSRNLLLGDSAEIFARPELEIYADEVECAHGATTGQLDAAALFYLQSRGLPATAARRLLIEAFVATALTPLNESAAAAAVNAVLADKLKTLLAESTL